MEPGPIVVFRQDWPPPRFKRGAVVSGLSPADVKVVVEAGAAEIYRGTEPGGGEGGRDRLSEADGVRRLS